MSRNKSLDLLKCFAMLMVVSLHVQVWNVWFSMGEINVRNAFQYFFRLGSEGVPIFLMVNGYLMLDKKMDLKKSVLKVLKLSVLLIVWAFIISFLCRLGTGTLSLVSVIKYVLDLSVASKHIGVLWYLQALIALYLLYPLLVIIRSESKALFNYLFIVVCFFSVGINLLKLLIDLIYSFGATPELYKVIVFLQRLNPFSNGIFLFYFMMGAFVKDYHNRLLEKKQLVILAGVFSWVLAFIIGMIISWNNNLLYSPSFIYSNISMVFMLMAIYVMCSLVYSIKIFKIDAVFWKIIESIGRNTLGIYLVHNIVIYYINRVIIFKGLAGRGLELILVFFISYGMVVVIKKIPVVNKLVSV